MSNFVDVPFEEEALPDGTFISGVASVRFSDEQDWIVTCFEITHHIDAAGESIGDLPRVGTPAEQEFYEILCWTDIVDAIRESAADAPIRADEARADIIRERA